MMTQDLARAEVPGCVSLNLQILSAKRRQERREVPHSSAGHIGHVDVRPQLREDTLLTMPGGELITNHRIPVEAHQNVGPLQAGI